MGVIQRQIEAQGISTVSLSLFRGFTEIVKPPRALWVPFPFGRPLGAPNNKEIQRKVLFTAFDLLKRDRGPVLEDLTLTEAEDHLDAKHQKIGQSCGPKGCNFDDALSSEAPASTSIDIAEETPRPIPEYDGDFAAVCTEIRALKDHHRDYLAKFDGRTQVGYSGADPETIEKVAENLDRFIRREPLTIPSGILQGDHQGATAQNAFARLCADDLKAYYLESRIASQPSDGQKSTEHNDWLWYETRIGSLVVAARNVVIQTTDRSKDPNWMIARAMVPRGYGESGYTMTSQNKVGSI